MTTAAELPGITPQAQGLSAGTIRDALERHYRKPGAPRDGEILIPEVQAPGSNRRADLVRVGMWASRGTGIDVHEIKVSRADWLRELSDPAKAEAWWPYCNRFWVVAVPGIIPVEELPEGWGLMELPGSGRRFKVRAAAATRTDIRLTVPLLVELLRRADNQRLAEIEAMRTTHRNELWKAQEAVSNERASGELPYETRQRLEALERIEGVLGVPLVQYSRDLGDQVTDVTERELAAFLADVRDHVSIQRRNHDLELRERRLIAAARHVIERYETAGTPA